VKIDSRVPRTMLASPAKGSPPVALARRFGQFAVQRNDAGFRKTRPHPAFQLRRQVDFRHQQQDLAAGRQRPLDQAQINLGLAAAGHAMQQMRRKSGRRVDGLDGNGLLIGQHRGARLRRTLPGPGIAPGRRIEPLQAGRQRLHHDFAEGRLIVSHWQTRTAAKSRGQRRHITEDFTGRLQLRQRPVTAVDNLGDHPDLLAPAERDANAQTDICGRRLRPRNRKADAAGDRGRRAKQA
jgi:hypothetical protein